MPDHQEPLHEELEQIRVALHQMASEAHQVASEAPGPSPRAPSAGAPPTDRSVQVIVEIEARAVTVERLFMISERQEVGLHGLACEPLPPRPLRRRVGSERRLLDGFRSGQRQPLRLFTPRIPVGPQIGDHAAQLSDQHVGCRVGCRGGFRLVSVARFRSETVTVGVEVSGQLGVVD